MKDNSCNPGDGVRDHERQHETSAPTQTVRRTETAGGCVASPHAVDMHGSNPARTTLQSGYRGA